MKLFRSSKKREELLTEYKYKEKVSIVMGSYNRAEFIEKTVKSIRDNGIELPYEIIVIDGGSEDGTLDWLIKQKDIITVTQNNRGSFNGKKIARRSWGYFMNLGFRIAEGRYILMISDDCLLQPGAVNCGVEKYRTAEAENSNIGGVAFYFRNWPQDDKYYVQRTIGGNLMVNHGIFSKSALESIGYADEDNYMFYKADGDLNLRLWKAGYRICSAEGAFVEHYIDKEEIVRMDNNSLLDEDRKSYGRIWKNVPSFEPVKEKPGRYYSNWTDSSGLADNIWGK